jgi:hypothetical protein
MMTLTDRYSNDNKNRTYLRISDPGHSWLEVPAKDVRDAAGVWDKITPYSPLKRHKFYLEEDLDMWVFYKAMLDNGYSVIVENINVDDFDEWLAKR